MVQLGTKTIDDGESGVFSLGQGLKGEKHKAGISRATARR